MKHAFLAVAMGLAAMFAAPSHGRDAAERWTPAEAKAWYAQQQWPLGSNYLPADAINQLEMWQADTFDPARIDMELGWAQQAGMTTMRVFLHDLLWQQDAAGLKKRMGTFLAIADQHGIKPIFVLFDSCWDPQPKLGTQHPPIPGVHNSGWVQSPGVAMADESQYPRFEHYVKDIVGSFGKDKRILAWDVWNEPDNPGGGNYDPVEPKNKAEVVAKLLPQVFAWARSTSPTQPLTSGVWHDDDWSDVSKLNAVERTQLEQSDVISFHDYGWPEAFAERVKQLQKYGRPMICTEYMARGNGSTIDGVLPIAKKADVGMVNWGFVVGKSQTNMPWDSWQRPYTMQPPTLWFHDLFHADGKPYRQREIDILRALSHAPRGVVPADALSYPMSQGAVAR
ncbi:Cellulase (glycosyl hydrolase family 5) [Dyella jiangningensis]|uniref:cellulase family glycosylhydrolase n=1 Tax=Dyella sp. AtDHG13 TaxID=1938897 RepID=UPI00088F5C65|nr:cellulase family glycosylhydrolase [Dyella sp. AtDHG13]PXV52394.1 cellulase (glycosyl hydrolase family 5) [Dyella sp. AtDHG13]SDL40016.1 Cellulase (glycosyl hydrolase family 5) [Dyella jiangningensis]